MQYNLGEIMKAIKFNVSDPKYDFFQNEFQINN